MPVREPDAGRVEALRGVPPLEFENDVLDGVLSCCRRRCHVEHDDDDLNGIVGSAWPVITECHFVTGRVGGTDRHPAPDQPLLPQFDSLFSADHLLDRVDFRRAGEIDGECLSVQEREPQHSAVRWSSRGHDPLCHRRSRIPR